MDLSTYLNADPLPWLLEPDAANPGVRYFALRCLLDRAPNHWEVQDAVEAVMDSGPVPLILSRQHPDGYWVKPGSGYSPKFRSTVWSMIFLAQFGARPGDEGVRRGGEYLLQNSIIPSSGAFTCTQSRTSPGNVYCLNGNLVWALSQLGFGGDPRLQRVQEWITRAVTGDIERLGASGPGFICEANDDLPCAWGAVKVLKALASIPPEQRTTRHQDAVESAAELLLSRDLAVADYPTPRQVSPFWFKFAFPLDYWCDILETADALATAGYGNELRLQNAVNYISSKQNEQGRWKLENTRKGRMWLDIEKRGKPGKWVTLRVLRFLKRI